MARERPGEYREAVAGTGVPAFVLADTWAASGRSTEYGGHIAYNRIDDREKTVWIVAGIQVNR